MNGIQPTDPPAAVAPAGPVATAPPEPGSEALTAWDQADEVMRTARSDEQEKRSAAIDFLLKQGATDPTKAVAAGDRSYYFSNSGHIRRA